MNEETGVLHLFMHILGFTHESSRFDRMDYIGVSDAYLNSTEFYRFPFAEDDQFIEYDYNSVLHHPAYISQDGLPNIYKPSRPSELADIQLESPFSEVDLLKLQLKYPCSSVNECLKEPSPCGHGLNECSNKPEGFACICTDGFDSVDETCVDIDECVDSGKENTYSVCAELFSAYVFIDLSFKTDLNTCNDPGTCINTPGGFRCEKRNIDIVWLVDGTGSWLGILIFFQN